jgi:hypothetical protein
MRITSMRTFGTEVVRGCWGSHGSVAAPGSRSKPMTLLYFERCTTGRTSSSRGRSPRIKSLTLARACSFACVHYAVQAAHALLTVGHDDAPPVQVAEGHGLAGRLNAPPGPFR